MTVPASLQRVFSPPRTFVATLLMLIWPLTVVSLTPSVGAWLPLTFVVAILWWRLPPGRRYWGAGLALGAALLVTLGHADSGVRAWPVIVNAGLCCVFAWSLRHPPSLIERIARRQDPELSASGVRYTRRVTQVWCVFFSINGVVALWTAVYADLASWALYNGGIAYGLCALLFAIEWCIRQRVRARQGSDTQAPSESRCHHD
ncbi:COG4648 family protein [Aidingimonas lacisalsi]|uniref:COG4648 family protein n=1 Tax=Aidingimonas lacisalsi TaxID=2604086 RepID=UPI0011D21349|nr:hypothetical protein [Aidingimonas lacisalsi]